jgi:hypothetical protein
LNRADAHAYLATIELHGLLAVNARASALFNTFNVVESAEDPPLLSSISNHIEPLQDLNRRHN